MSESLGDAVLVLRTDQRKFDQGIDSAERATMGLDARFKKLGQSLAGFGDKMTTRVSLPIAAVSIAAFKMAADADEASNKFEVVMGDSADAVRKKLKALEATIPLTTGEMLTLAAGVQDMVVPMGLARDAGAEMSLAMVSLAGDIAAFNDTTPAQVLNDMKSALAGSSEPLFKYGVDTRVAALQAVALKNGLIEQGEALNNAARSQAILLQIQAQSTDAMGAAAREASGASAQYRFLWRDVKQLAEEIGTTLIPIITPLIEKAREWLKWFRELSPATQTLIVKAGLLFAALGPVLSITGRLIGAGGSLVKMYKSLTLATTANTAATVLNTTAQRGSLASFLGFFTTMRQGRNSLGQFTTSMTGFQKFFSGPGSFAASFGLLKTQIGRMGTGIAGLGTKFLGLGSSIASTTGTVIAMANPWSLAVITVSALAGAIASYLAAEGGAIEQHFARTEESLKSLNGEFNRFGTTAFQQATSLDFLGRVMIKLKQAIEDGVPGAQEARRALWELMQSGLTAEQALGQLARQSNRAGDAARVLRPALIEVSAEMNAAGRAAAALAEANRLAAEEELAHKARLKTMADAIGRLGLTTLPEAIAKVADLGLAIAAGTVPTSQLSDAIDKLWQELNDLDLLTPELRTKLIGFKGAVGEIEDPAKRAASALNDMFAAIGRLDVGVGAAMRTWSDADDVLVEFAEFTLPAIVPPLKDVETGTKDATVELDDMFGSIRTGIPQVDSFLGKMKGFLGIFKSIVGVLGSASKGIGSFFSKLGGGGADAGGGFNLGGLFGGGGVDSFFTDPGAFNIAGQGAGTGILAGLKSVMGKVSNLLPIIGPLLSIFGGPLLKGIKAIAGKIGGFFKNIFGGVSEVEKAGRSAAAAFRDSVRSELSAEVLADVKLQFPNQVQNAAFLASIQQKLIAAGVAAEAAGIQARQWGTQLFEAEKKGGAAVQGVIDQISAATQVAIDSTSATAQASADVADNVAKKYKAMFEQINNDASLSAEERAQALKAVTIAQEVAMQDQVSKTKKAQADMASSSISAAALAGKAWEKSASNTVAAWKAARNATVGTSSILDIEELGTEAARRLGAAHAEAAEMTGDAWRNNAGDIARVLAELETATGERRGVLDRLLDTLGHDGSAAFDIGRRGFDGNGRCIKLEVNSILDGDKVAESVVRKIPDVLDDAGLGC